MNIVSVCKLNITQLLVVTLWWNCLDVFAYVVCTMFFCKKITFSFSYKQIF
jgi:hypothetical protein